MTTRAIRDIEFNLFEVFPDLFTGPFADFDRGDIKGLLGLTSALAEGPFADGYRYCDLHPPVFDAATHSVTLPPPFITAYEAYRASELWRLDLPESLGGRRAPRILWWMLHELLLGANAPVIMASLSASFARIVWTEGTPDQQLLAQIVVDRDWAATMMLTEPEAGSDVGAGTCKAILQPDGTWHLEGRKRFITGGEHDGITENTMHLTLARRPDAPPGTKGLSCFLVPKYRFNPDGSLGDRNGVFAVGMYRKMGLHGSPTMEMELGLGDVPAVGYLLGDIHDGMRQMFLVIEMARMLVSTQAVGLLSAGYDTAVDYALQRVQGPDLLDRKGPRIGILGHPNVRQSLLVSKAYVEGLRALICYISSWQDQGTLARESGNAKAARYADRMCAMLLPIVKGMCGDRAFSQLGELLQILGGSGYTTDYTVEQNLRDSRIVAVYEGTIDMQFLDLIFRQLIFGGPKPAKVLMREARRFVRNDLSDPEFKDVKSALSRALYAIQRIFNIQEARFYGAESDPRSLYLISMTGRQTLLAAGDVLIGWLLARQAKIAHEALQAGGLTDADKLFYQGKIEAAKEYARVVLSRIRSDADSIKNASLGMMALPEGAF